MSKRVLLLATCVLVATIAARTADRPSAAALAGGQAPATKSPATQVPAQAPASQAPPAAGYAGADTCATCHEDQANKLKGTPHDQARNPRTPAAAHGCETCHGPGQAHVDDDASGKIEKMNVVHDHDGVSLKSIEKQTIKRFLD